MKIGLGLPTVFPSDGGELLLEWARRADAAGFSSLSILDRIVYDNYEPIVALTAAAAVTKRIRLNTSVLLAATRNAGVLAKQAASLDSISGGRLTLGLAAANREDDFIAAPASYHDRGKRFEEQLALMKRIWSGEPAADGTGPVGPAPVQKGGPEILIGGRAPAALRRGARWADGYIAGSVSDPAGARTTFDLFVEAWKEQGRSGTPRFVGTIAGAIGEEAAKLTAERTMHYYSYQAGPPGNAPGQPGPSGNLPHIPATKEQIIEIIKRCEDAGVDEVMVKPGGVTDPDQVDLLAEALL